MISSYIIIINIVIDAVIFSLASMSCGFLGILFIYFKYGVEIIVTDNNLHYSYVFLYMNIITIVLGLYRIKRILDK